MDTAIIAFVAVVIAVAVLALVVPLRLVVSAQGRGDPTGAWALAGGAQIGPLVASGVGAHGVTPRIELRLFGRKVWGKALVELVGAENRTEGAENRFHRAKARYARLERWLDPIELGLWLVGERRRVHVDRLVLKLRYSFQDIAVTGKMMGAVYVLSGLLPPKLELLQEVSWESVDRASAALDGRIKLWPGLILVDSALFMLRNVRIRKRSSEGARQTT